jgi:hypothetical protein
MDLSMYTMVRSADYRIYSDSSMENGSMTGVRAQGKGCYSDSKWSKGGEGEEAKNW